ncbi:MAG: hypothetical protein J5I59_05185 [Saprospiraceae bacterium]|nr:hypothetical protein [Saprospiraceae bacterium]
MKGLFFILAFIGFVGFSNLNAQCAKAGSSCCAKKTASVDKVSPEVVAKAAAADKTIKAKKEKDGTITYTRKVKDPVTGKKVRTEVVYDAATAKFVNATPDAHGKACAGEMKDGKACSKKDKMEGSCCSKKGSASADIHKPAVESSSKM